MATLTPTQSADPIPQLETYTLALAGPGNIMNAQAQALLNRVEYYKMVSNDSTIFTQTTTSYTPALADAGTTQLLNSASATTVTVPPNESVAFRIGTNIDLFQQGVGKVTVVPGSGVTVNSLKGYTILAGQYAGVTLRKVATDTWFLVGALSPL